MVYSLSLLNKIRPCLFDNYTLIFLIWIVIFLSNIIPSSRAFLTCSGCSQYTTTYNLGSVGVILCYDSGTSRYNSVYTVADTSYATNLIIATVSTYDNNDNVYPLTGGGVSYTYASTNFNVYVTSGVLSFDYGASITLGSIILVGTASCPKSMAPTVSPRVYPTVVPSKRPTAIPSISPTTLSPSLSPSRNPTYKPSANPSVIPSMAPSTSPSNEPSASPTMGPTNNPTTYPTVSPSKLPSVIPSFNPTLIPSSIPTSDPSCLPTTLPSTIPSSNPSTTPSVTPSSVTPSVSPTLLPSSIPTSVPSCLPTTLPSTTPSISPSTTPSVTPSVIPTNLPTSVPTHEPTCCPTIEPSLIPTTNPTTYPTNIPSSIAPSALPSQTPSSNPSTAPTFYPTAEPSFVPTCYPSNYPTVLPSSIIPTHTPTQNPSSSPTSSPTCYPSILPSCVPTSTPSHFPSTSPTNEPTNDPSITPSWIPSCNPSYSPSFHPSWKPSTSPSGTRTSSPTQTPSQQPSFSPTIAQASIPTQTSPKLPKSPSVGYIGRVIINPLSLTITKVNPSDKLLLVGSIYMTSTAVAVWTMNNSTTKLNELSPLTPTQVVIPSRSNYTLNLVLPPNSLIGGLIYTFRLQCSGMTAMVQVLTNAPPSSGNFSVNPLIGTERKTSFEFLASYWMDEDLPISYQFGFSSDNSNNIVQDKSLASKGDSPLPAGHSSFGYQVVCYVKVFDRLNAFNFKYFRVVVNMVDDAELSDLITRRVANASVSQLIQTISVVSFTLNSVSCFHSPNCFVRNRQNCSTVRDTCGSCYPGFIGEDGSHNSHCSSKNDLSRIVNIGVGNTVCSKDDDCNNLQICDKIKGKCVHPPKACPNLCSNNGNCTFVNINSGAIVTDCSVLSSDCTAICKCSKEYGGLDCSLTSKKLREKQKLWHQLLVKLSEITISGNTNSNRRVLCGNCSNSNSNSALESWTVSLSSLTQKPSEISPSSSSIITSVIESILTQSLAMGQSYGGISNILDSINTEAELSKEQEKLSISLKSQLQQFNSLVANQIVVGQRSVENIKSSFRTSVSVVDSSSLQNITISLPVSTLEKTLSSYQPNSVNFYYNEMITSFDTSSAVKVSVTEVASKMYTNMSKSLTSNSVDIHISGSNFNLSHNVVVTLYNIGVNEQPFDTIPVNFTTVCRNGKSLNGIYNFTCSNSGRFLNHNCTQTDGVYISYCPVLRPTCHVLDSTSKINNCKVIEYSSIFTKCSCSFLISHGRRISADSNNLLQSSGVLSIASMSEYVGNEFVDSFAASGDFFTAKGLENALTLIIMFIVIWVGGVALILTCAWRRRRMLSKNEKDIEHLKRKAQSAKISRSPAAIFSSLQLYISEIFPSVFGNESRIHRMISEIKKHHRYLNIFTASHGDVGDRSRFLTGIQLLTVQTLLIFLLSLFYYLQGPDNDGSCVAFTSKSSCLARKSYLDPKQSYCLWTSDPTAANTQYPCNFQDPSFSFQIIAYIAIIVALVTALFLKPIDMIFEFLSAPLADSVKVKAADSTIKRVGRRMGMLGIEVDF